MYLNLRQEAALVGLFALTFGTKVNALWSCGADQKVFPLDTEKFLIHFTSARDSNIDGGDPWNFAEKCNPKLQIRICLPQDDGTWKDIKPLAVTCQVPKGSTFSQDDTDLDADIEVIAGTGCNNNRGGLEGASITYKDQSVNLQYGGDACGPRDHGITCQFTR